MTENMYHEDGPTPEVNDAERELILALAQATAVMPRDWRPVFLAIDKVGAPFIAMAILTTGCCLQATSTWLLTKG